MVPGSSKTSGGKPPIESSGNERINHTRSVLVYQIRFSQFAGSGFGSDLSLAILNSTTTMTPVTVDPTALTFLAPPSQEATSLEFLLTVNDVNKTFSVNYSAAATPTVLGVVGSYPEGALNPLEVQVTAITVKLYKTLAVMTLEDGLWLLTTVAASVLFTVCAGKDKPNIGSLKTREGRHEMTHFWCHRQKPAICH